MLRTSLLRLIILMQLLLIVASNMILEMKTSMQSLANNNMPKGVMFDLKAGPYSSVEIVDFDHYIENTANVNGPVTVEVYTCNGSFAQVHDNTNAWTLLASVTVTPAGPNALTTLGIGSTFLIPADTVKGIYITVSSTGGVSNCGEAAAAQQIQLSAFNHLTLYTGYRKPLYPFGGFGGFAEWVGLVRYRVADLEKVALMNIYHQTNGPNWSNSTSHWNITDAACSFHGVFCANGSSVTKIVLENNGLTGTIPEDFAFLSNLATLNLNGNSLNGFIPGALAKLMSLERLVLRKNLLTQIDQEFLNHLPTNLQYFSASLNDLQGQFPQEFSSLSALTYFSLRGNSLNGLLPNFDNKFFVLKELHLQDNSFSGEIPNSIGSVFSLKRINLSNNELVGTIPTSIVTLTNLRNLRLGRNDLTGLIPIDQLEALPNLTVLTLDRNGLVGSIGSSSALCQRSFEILKVECQSVSCHCCTNCFAPSEIPSSEPSSRPVVKVTSNPSLKPSSKPSAIPSQMPSAVPSNGPSITKSVKPTLIPSTKPSIFPTQLPSIDPTVNPTGSPSDKPSVKPVTITPTKSSNKPSNLPSITRDQQISGAPTKQKLVQQSVITNIIVNGVGGLSLNEQDVFVFETALLNFFKNAFEGSRVIIIDVNLLSSNSRLLRIDKYRTRVLQSEASISVEFEVILQAPSVENAGMMVNEALFSGSNNLIDALATSGSEFFANVSSINLATQTTTPAGSSVGIPMIPPSGSPSSIPSKPKTLRPSTAPSHVPSINLFSLPPSGVPSLSIFSVRPSTEPSSKITTYPIDAIVIGSSPAPSKHPVVPPSSVPSISPTTSLEPSTLPTLVPTQVPSNTPSRSDPVVGSYIISSILEKSTYSNSTWADRLVDYDFELKEHMSIQLGNCTIEVCESRRRRRLDDQVVFAIIGVNSEPDVNAPCVPTSNITLCQQINTDVSFLHYEPLYSYERSKLIVVRESVRFIDENPEDVLYDGPRTKIAKTVISLTIEGVEQEEMNETEIEILEESVTLFLDKVLANFDPPVDIVDVQFDSQSWQLNVIGSEKRRRRYLQGETSQQSVGNNNDGISSVTVSIAVTGEYLPPPEVDFSLVVVDSFDDDGDDFKEIVEELSVEKNVTYFKNMTTAKATAVIIMESYPSVATASFGGLGNDAGLSLILVGVSLLILILCYQGYKVFYKLKKRKESTSQIQMTKTENNLDMIESKSSFRE